MSGGSGRAVSAAARGRPPSPPAPPGSHHRSASPWGPASPTSSSCAGCRGGSCRGRAAWYRSGVPRRSSRPRGGGEALRREQGVGDAEPPALCRGTSPRSRSPARAHRSSGAVGPRRLRSCSGPAPSSSPPSFPRCRHPRSSPHPGTLIPGASGSARSPRTPRGDPRITPRDRAASPRHRRGSDVTPAVTELPLPARGESPRSPRERDRPSPLDRTPRSGRGLRTHLVYGGGRARAAPRCELGASRSEWTSPPGTCPPGPDTLGKRGDTGPCLGGDTGPCLGGDTGPCLGGDTGGQGPLPEGGQGGPLQGVSAACPVRGSTASGHPPSQPPRESSPGANPSRRGAGTAASVRWRNAGRGGSASGTAPAPRRAEPCTPGHRSDQTRIHPASLHGGAEPWGDSGSSGPPGWTRLLERLSDKPTDPRMSSRRYRPDASRSHPGSTTLAGDRG